MYVLAYFLLLLDPLDTDHELHVLIKEIIVLFMIIDREWKLCNISQYHTWKHATQPLSLMCERDFQFLPCKWLSSINWLECVGWNLVSECYYKVKWVTIDYKNTTILLSYRYDESSLLFWVVLSRWLNSCGTYYRLE